jgi:hypothetical protein
MTATNSTAICPACEAGDCDNSWLCEVMFKCGCGCHERTAELAEALRYVDMRAQGVLNHEARMDAVRARRAAFELGVTLATRRAA